MRRVFLYVLALLSVVGLLAAIPYIDATTKAFELLVQMVVTLERSESLTSAGAVNTALLFFLVAIALVSDAAAQLARIVLVMFDWVLRRYGVQPRNIERLELPTSGPRFAYAIPILLLWILSVLIVNA
jgi:hypothetical protein